MFTQRPLAGVTRTYLTTVHKLQRLLEQWFKYKANQFHSLPRITSVRYLITNIPLSDRTRKQFIQNRVSPVLVRTETLFNFPCLPRHENSSVVANKPYVLSSELCQRKFVITRMTLNKRTPRIFSLGEGV